MKRREFLQSCAAGAFFAGAGEGRGRSPASEDENISRAMELQKKYPVVVIHDHRPIADDIPKMEAGRVAAKLFNIGVDVDIGGMIQESGRRRQGWKQQTMKSMHEALDEIKGTQNAVLARTAHDVEVAHRQGKPAILLGVEGGKLLEGDIQSLDEFHALGLRELQLRWGVPNQIVEDQELTPFGVSVVRRCQELRIIIDLTHIPQQAFDQVMELAQTPVIVSHGTAAELGSSRVEAIAAKQGVIGIHFYSSYLGASPRLENALDAIDALAKQGGIETVALGIDFFPTDGPWREHQLAQGTKDISWAIPSIDHLPEVTAGLLGRGYQEEQIAAILGGNFLRVARSVFGA